MWQSKIVLITGTSRGIGKALALKLAAENAIIILTARDPGSLTDVLNNININGGVSEVLKIDVTNDSDIRSARKHVEDKYGRLDILINNAGIMYRTPFIETPIENARNEMETNYFGVFRMIKEFKPLLQPGSSIVNISSVIGKVGVPRATTYCATKFALNGFSQALRMELKKDNIHLLTYMPGLTDTDMAAGYENEFPKKMSVDVVVDDLIKAVEKRKREAVPGLMNKLFVGFGIRYGCIIEKLLLRIRS